MESILKLTEVSKSFAGKKALDQVSLTLAHGKIVGLLGSNGSGKSTLMKIAAGLIHPGSGTVTVNGHLVSNETKAITSFMPDQPLTESWMRVEDAIDFIRIFMPILIIRKPMKCLLS